MFVVDRDFFLSCAKLGLEIRSEWSLVSTFVMLAQLEATTVSRGKNEVGYASEDRSYGKGCVVKYQPTWYAARSPRSLPQRFVIAMPKPADLHPIFSNLTQGYMGGDTN